MARRKKYPQAETDVKAHSVEARYLYTLGPEHKVWAVKDPQTAVKALKLKDSLVRLQPPHDATDAAVARLVALLETQCAAVRPAPRAPSPAVVGKPAADVVAAAGEGGGVNHRAVVMRVAEQSFAEDKDALEELLTRWISEAEK